MRWGSDEATKRRSDADKAGAAYAALTAACVVIGGCSSPAGRPVFASSADLILAVDLDPTQGENEHTIDLPDGLKGAARLFVHTGDTSVCGWPVLHCEPPEALATLRVSKVTSPDWSSTWTAYDREKFAPFSEPTLTWFEFWLTPRCDAPLRILVEWRDSTDAHSASPSPLRRSVASSLPSGATP